LPDSVVHHAGGGGRGAASTGASRRGTATAASPQCRRDPPPHRCHLLNWPAVPTAAPVPMVDDHPLIRERSNAIARLQRNSTRGWLMPCIQGVDLTALEHAFDDLRSQSLQFDVCNFEVHGPSARATCRGSARYVPKMAAETASERRVWTFRLDKDDRDWKIASGVAEAADGWPWADEGPSTKDSLPARSQCRAVFQPDKWRDRDVRPVA